MKVQRWQRAEPPDESTSRAEADGYSVYAWTDAPGTTYPPHTHGDDQSHWVVRGSIALTVSGEEYALGAGDRDWLPSGTVHAARVVGRSPVTYLVGSKR